MPELPDRFYPVCDWPQCECSQECERLEQSKQWWDDLTEEERTTLTSGE